MFKFPEGEEAETALRREARLLQAVAPRVSLPVPRMTLHDGPPLFSRHDKLPGVTLERAAYDALTQAQRDGLAGDLARFFADLHAIEPQAMRAAGAEPVGWWDTHDETLAPVWERLPRSIAEEGRKAIAAYRNLPPDPLGERYGFFDAHGWNMAFDVRAGRLNGIFDFADSGFGPVHREFAPVSLVAPDLAARTARAYAAASGREVSLRRIFLLTAAMRLSEYAGALETGVGAEWVRDLVVEWFEQRDVR
ncbi:aminoglycoside phosphotransferase family protein [Mesorhizobium sp. J428]|nr:aminoglycoside phosphotransferase family protein [Mesorhizobium sp. J428]